jgi:hypothetical protein
MTLNKQIHQFQCEKIKLKISGGHFPGVRGFVHCTIGISGYIPYLFLWVVNVLPVPEGLVDMPGYYVMLGNEGKESVAANCVTTVPSLDPKVLHALPWKERKSMYHC